MIETSTSKTGCKVPSTSSFRVDSTNGAVREALADMMVSVIAAGVTDDLCQNLELVLAEVLNNVVEHAYQEQPDGWIDVLIQCTPEDLRATVRDGGRSMPDAALPSGGPADVTVPAEDLPEGGFGWFLIRSLTNNLSYKREGNSNVTFFSVVV